LLTEEQKSESTGSQKKLERKFIVSYTIAKPFHFSCKRLLPFLWTKTKQLHHSWDTECIQFSYMFIVNLNTVVSFHHTMAMKHHLEDDETEQQLILNFDSNCCMEDEAYD
jgi:hypothetical protein